MKQIRLKGSIIVLVLLVTSQSVLSCEIGEYSYTDENGKTQCLQICNGFINDGTNVCKKTCAPGEYALDLKQIKSNMRLLAQQDYLKSCSINCTKKFSFTDGLGILRCSDDCPLYLSSDKNKCLNKCDEGEFVYQKNPNFQFYQCLKTCPDDWFVIIKDSGEKYCTQKFCPQVVSSDSNECQSQCKPNEYLYTKNNIPKCVKTCNPDNQFEYISSSGIKMCTDTCPFIVDQEQKCVKSCKEGEYIKDKDGNQNETCTESCDSYSYILDGLKRCAVICPSDYYPTQSENNEKICTKKSDCKGIMSSQTCVQECNSSRHEYPREMNGYRQCQQCQYIYNKLNKTCSKKCGEGEVYFSMLQQCLKTEDLETECTNNYGFLSTDLKTCSINCANELFSKKLNKCVKQCEENEYETTDGITVQCVSTCPYYISADKTKCVTMCPHIGEIDPIEGNNCEKCPDSQYPVVFQQAILCADKKESNYLEKQYASLTNLFNLNFRSMYQLITMKNAVSELQKDLIVRNQFKDSSKKLSSILDYILLLNNVGQSFDRYSPLTIGSKEDIMTMSQIKVPEYKFKRNLVINQIQNQQAEALIEEVRDSNEEQYFMFMVTLIAQNPACNLSDCSSYPVITVHPPMNPNFSRILQQQSEVITTNQSYTTTYTVKDTSNLKKYICLSYNIYDSTVQPKVTTTTIENDNKSITCLVDGDVQLFFDQKCQFVDKILCPKENEGQEIQMEESEDKLNGGEIAGIVIGSIAFIGVVSLLIIQLVKKRKLIKSTQNKTENAKNKYQIQTQGVTEADQKA